MIKIAKNIWWVVGVDREDNLAYMCPYEEGKNGEPLSNVAKMQSTGRVWARSGPVGSQEIGEEFTAENSPINGFYVGSSVSRWSTSNKLFRVKDPRGFTVEIPTDNLATLLHHTTVVKGVVQEDCVWGREGNNHILLPTNSEPYLETLNKMDTLANKLYSAKDLKAGDWVKFFEDNIPYYYVGKVKPTFKVRGVYQPSYWDGRWGNAETKYSEWVEVEDTKWTDLFIYKSQYSEEWWVETPSKPKIVEIVKNDPMDVDISTVRWYCPQRITNQITNLHDHYNSSEEELIGWKVK